MKRFALRIISVLVVFLSGTAASHAQTVLTASSFLPPSHFLTRDALVASRTRSRRRRRNRSPPGGSRQNSERGTRR